MFIELVWVIEVLFDGIDEMVILEKILQDEKAYEVIRRLYSAYFYQALDFLILFFHFLGSRFI